MASVSAVVMTLNEERNIEYCLRSVRSWCDEVIVVDMVSQDRTREIAGRYADEVLEHERIQGFDAGRTKGFERATGDWILSIDADEVITPELAEWDPRVRRGAIALRAGAHPARQHLPRTLDSPHPLVAGQAAPLPPRLDDRLRPVAPRPDPGRGLPDQAPAARPEAVDVALLLPQPRRADREDEPLHDHRGAPGHRARGAAAARTKPADRAHSSTCGASTSAGAPIATGWPA